MRGASHPHHTRHRQCGGYKPGSVLVLSFRDGVEGDLPRNFCGMVLAWSPPCLQDPKAKPGVMPRRPLGC